MLEFNVEVQRGYLFGVSYQLIEGFPLCEETCADPSAAPEGSIVIRFHLD